MMSFAFLAAAVTICSAVSTETNPSQIVAGVAGPAAPQIVGPVLLKRDTPIELMATKEISTANAVSGSRFKLRVNRAVSVAGKPVIPVGAWAHGEVSSAEESGGLGKSGRMTARLLYLEAGNAQIPLEGQISAKGTGAGSAGVAILFTGVAGLFHRGNNAKIKAGELLSAFVADDVWLDMSTMPSQRVAAPIPTAMSSTVSVVK